MSPRSKTPLFSMDELRAMEQAGGKTAEWARNEIKRREAAGRNGGRPVEFTDKRHEQVREAVRRHKAKKSNPNP